MQTQEQPKRPQLPTSSTDFALPASSSSSLLQSSGPSQDDLNILHQRFRRPSLLAPKYLSETRLHSPLALSILDPHTGRKRYGTSTPTGNGEESDTMWTDSSPSVSSADATPPQMELDANAAIMSGGRTVSGSGTTSKRRSPSTPPPKARPLPVADSAAVPEKTPQNLKRHSLPLKTPRVLRLLTEDRPEEDEVKSEAAFQRLISSLPMQPRTPSDRGRYPEEASVEEVEREQTPSDDGEEVFAFNAIPGCEPIFIGASSRTGRVTPSINGDDYVPESPSISAMEVDSMSASPSFSSISSAPTSWRYTPPPTSSAVRSNKRKLDDRFEPYPSVKRRAVSPSLAHLRDSSLPHSPRATHPSRVPIPVPINIPSSGASSATSSPTITTQYLPPHGKMPMSPAMTASPTARPPMGLSSPILRPVARMRWGPENEREVDGAGEAVHGLSLG